MNDQSLKKYFLIHLNKIYCAKQHLLAQLPGLTKLAGFTDLREVIEDADDEIGRQLVRIDEIFKNLKEVHQPDNCNGFKCLVNDVFEDVSRQEGDRRLQDMSIIYYLQNIQSLQMASFQALQLAAVKFKNKLVNELLEQNFKEAKAERDLLLLLSAKYLIS